MEAAAAMAVSRLSIGLIAEDGASRDLLSLAMDTDVTLLATGMADTFDTAFVESGPVTSDKGEIFNWGFRHP